MKFYINRSVVDGPWGGGNNFVKAIYNYLPPLGYEIIEDPFVVVPDIIFLQNPKPDSIDNFSINEAVAIKKNNPSVKIILRVNDCDERKNTKGVDDMWVTCSAHIDATIFVSKWMKSYFLKKGWQCNDNFVLYNGVNLKHFKKQEKINNGKINIVTHHWSNNRLKGFDIYEKLDNYISMDNKLTFTYIGRDLNTFKNTTTVPPLFGQDLGAELGKYDVYISASKSDPGPNHILESLACDIPTYVKEGGGGCIEFAGNSHTYREFHDFIDIIKENKIRNNDSIKVTSWEKCIDNLSTILGGLQSDKNST